MTMQPGESADGAPPSLTIEGQVALIRLNRPRVHNRIEPDDLAALTGLFEAVERQAELRVLVLTATGRSFSSGYHIGELGQGRAAAIPSFESVVDRLERLRLPTICALNGSVFGGSTDLALACDFRLGVAGMRLVMPAARLGLHYYVGGLRRYVDRLGLAAAKRLFLTAEPMTAEELLRIGYLDEIVAPEALLPRAEALAATIAARAPLAVQGMKAALNDIARGDADFAAITAREQAVIGSADFAEGRAAWLEKREPRFVGA